MRDKENYTYLSLDTIERIRRELKRRKMTQKTLADQANLSPNNLSAVLHQKAPASYKYVDKIAAVLEVNTLWLLYGTESPKLYRNRMKKQILGEISEIIREKGITTLQLLLISAILRTEDSTLKSIYENMQFQKRILSQYEDYYSVFSAFRDSRNTKITYNETIAEEGMEFEKALRQIDEGKLKEYERLSKSDKERIWKELESDSGTDILEFAEEILKKRVPLKTDNEIIE